MRHRSSRPLFDLRYLRPLLADFVRQSAALTRARFVVALAAVFGVALAGVMATSVLVSGEPRIEVVVASPGDLRSGSAATGGALQTPVAPTPDAPDAPDAPDTQPLPPSSAPDVRVPTGTPSSLAPSGTSAWTPTGTSSYWMDAGPLATAPQSPSASPEGPAAGTADPPDTDDPGSVVVDGSSPVTTAATSSAEGDAWAVVISADEPASFECSLDGDRFKSCESTVEYTGLDPGLHTLVVRATDLAGNLDESPPTLRRHPSGKKSTAN